MKTKRKLLSRLMTMLIAACIISMQLPITGRAMTKYISNGINYEEGYIIVGESHAAISSVAVSFVSAANGGILHWSEDLSYAYICDSTESVTDEGNPNTYTISGNLFFVFEGMSYADRMKQGSKEFIYSDGRGSRGSGVEKIHQIMKINPNIKHWNIISMQGALAAHEGTQSMANYYVNSYRNWINYEFPNADCYFMSLATSTKYYRGVKNVEVFNNSLAAAFPDKYLDFSAFYKSKTPADMTDTLHWNHETYVEIISEAIAKVCQKRGTGTPKTTTKITNAVNTKEVCAILHTNDKTAVYTAPSLTSKLLLPKCEAGLPVLVTGITENGFFRVAITADRTPCYIAGYGLE